VIWTPAPDRPQITPDTLHVWRIDLNREDGELAALRATLSEDELARAARFRFEWLRRRFIAARGALRNILAAYLGADAAALRFTYSAYGKPSLAGASLRFNLSHSNELALVAVAAGCEVGVDVEFMRPDTAGSRIAERFFSPREVEALRALPPAEQLQGFFNCWTRKEAFIKAVGQGLSYPLDAFDVTLAPGEPAAVLAIRGDAALARRWTLQALSPGEGYAGAAAVEAKIHRVSCWEWLAREKETRSAWKTEKTPQSTKWL